MCVIINMVLPWKVRLKLAKKFSNAIHPHNKNEDDCVFLVLHEKNDFVGTSENLAK